MSDTWFISDLHLGHSNILRFEPVARPFEALEEMHEAIIARWNAVVQKYDKVFVLGDFAFSREGLELAARLRGQKRLILGNHDTYAAPDYLKYFRSVHGVVFWGDCILTHVPVHPSQLESRSRYNVHGHLHSRQISKQSHLQVDPRYINVSCEQNNLTPINASELFK